MRSIRETAGIRVEPLTAGQAREDAEAIVAAAQARAARIVADAERAVEQSRANAANEARTSAREAVVAEWTARIRDAAPSLAIAERELVTMALEIARSVLDREAERSSSLLEASARRALSRVRRARTVVLRVHPEDLPLAVERARGWLAPGAEPSVFDVLEDSTVERGGVVVECELGRIDARLSSQLDAIARALQAE